MINVLEGGGGATAAAWCSSVSSSTNLISATSTSINEVQAAGTEAAIDIVHIVDDIIIVIRGRGGVGVCRLLQHYSYLLLLVLL